MTRASVYPTTLDTIATLPYIRGLGQNAPEGTMEHAIKEIFDALVAIEAKVGVDSSTVLTSLDNMAQGGVRYEDVQLTAAQVNALVATNIELVAAPAAGLARYPVAVHLFLDHGGTDFVQTVGTDHLAIKYAASNEIAELGSEAQCTALIEAAADAALIVPITGAFVPEAAKAINLDNNGANEYATGDGTLSVRTYFVEFPMAAFT